MRFIETYFQPVAVENYDGNPAGLFTGYYQPELPGSMTRHQQFQTPLYAPPSAGPLHASRSEIDRGALNGKARVLAYVDDPVSAFFMQVQGSGLIRLEDGSTLSLAYAGTNGLSYTAIGRTLVADGSMQPADVDADAIRAWLHQHSDRAQTVMERNARYVYFKTTSDGQPVGAAGRTFDTGRQPGRRSRIRPARDRWSGCRWIRSAGQLDASPDVRRRQGCIAITGAVRGDLYLGAGPEAGAGEAGFLKAKGRYWILKFPGHESGGSRQGR